MEIIAVRGDRQKSYRNIIRPVNYYTVPNDGIHWAHLHDWQTPQFDFQQRSKALNYKKDPPDNALPDVFYLNGSDPGQFTFLPENAQWFWFELIGEAVNWTLSHAQMLVVWRSVIQESRALTDNHSPEAGFKDYITGRNVNNPDAKDMAIANMTAGGNYMRQKEKLGQRVYFHTLKVNDLPRAKDIFGDWSLVHFATESAWVRFPDKSYKVSRWPQCTPAGTPFPFISIDGVLWTWKYNLKILEPGGVYSWYNPANA